MLDMAHRTLTFSGLPEEQVIPEYDPNVTQYGHFILDADNLNKWSVVYNNSSLIFLESKIHAVKHIHLIDFQ